ISGVTDIVGAAGGNTYAFFGDATLKGKITNPASTQNNVLDYSNATTANLVVDGSTHKASNLFGGLDNGFTNITRVIGTANSESFDAVDDILFDGGGGADVLTARDSGDTMLGGSGNDALTGGVGSDSLSGDAGDDVLIGNATESTKVTITGDVTAKLP